MPVLRFTGLWVFFFHYAVCIKARFIFTVECRHTPTSSLPGSAAILVEVTHLHRQPIEQYRWKDASGIKKRVRKGCGPHLTGVANCLHWLHHVKRWFALVDVNHGETKPSYCPHSLSSLYSPYLCAHIWSRISAKWDESGWIHHDQGSVMLWLDKEAQFWSEGATVFSAACVSKTRNV